MKWFLCQSCMEDNHDMKLHALETSQKTLKGVGK
jgi:hypothetical protein